MLVSNLESADWLGGPAGEEAQNYSSRASSIRWKGRQEATEKNCGIPCTCPVLENRVLAVSYVLSGCSSVFSKLFGFNADS